MDGPLAIGWRVYRDEAVAVLVFDIGDAVGNGEELSKRGGFQCCLGNTVVLDE